MITDMMSSERRFYSSNYVFYLQFVYKERKSVVKSKLGTTREVESREVF